MPFGSREKFILLIEHVEKQVLMDQQFVEMTANSRCLDITGRGHALGRRGWEVVGRDVKGGNLRFEKKRRKV